MDVLSTSTFKVIVFVILRLSQRSLDPFKWTKAKASCCVSPCEAPDYLQERIEKI